MGGSGPYEYIAVQKSLLKPIIEKSKKKNYVVLTFFANDNLPINKNKRALLQNAVMPILNYSNNEVFPKTEYTKNIDIFIENNFPQGEELIRIYKRKHFKHTFIYQVSTLVPIRQKFNEIKGIIKNKKTEQIEDNQNNKISPSEESILTLSQICQKKCKPFIAYIPPSKLKQNIPGSDKYKIKLSEYSKKYNIDFIDGEEVINTDDISDYARKGHLNKEGYKKMADLISSKITDK